MPRVASDEITIMDITDGDPAPRLASRRLFRALTSVPQTPAAIITWATNALSSIETGWSETAPTQQAASATSVYFSDLLFSDTTGTATSTTATGTSPLPVTSFSGLVTFSSGDFSKDGYAITDIDGGNISTNSIIAATVSVGNLVVDSSARPVSGSGAIVSSSGDVSFGDPNQNVSWDSSSGLLTVQGDIVNISPMRRSLQTTGWNLITSSDSSFTLPVGSGIYRMIVWGSGGSGATNTSTYWNTGGGAAGVAVFDYVWNGTDTLAIVIGTQAQASQPGAQTTVVASTSGNLSVTANGGGAGSTLSGIGTTSKTASGGTGGSATATGLSTSNVVTATGGRGGDATGIINNSGTRFLSGGGAVNIFAPTSTTDQTITRGGDIDAGTVVFLSSFARVCSGGGSVWGPPRNIESSYLAGGAHAYSSSRNDFELGFIEAPTRVPGPYRGNGAFTTGRLIKWLGTFSTGGAGIYADFIAGLDTRVNNFNTFGVGGTGNTQVATRTTASTSIIQGSASPEDFNGIDTGGGFFAGSAGSKGWSNNAGFGGGGGASDSSAGMYNSQGGPGGMLWRKY